MIGNGTLDKDSGAKFYRRGRSVFVFFLCTFVSPPTAAVANAPMGRLGFHRPGECPWPNKISTKKDVRKCDDPTVNRLPVHTYEALRPKKKLYQV
jgi:hypothetical protein